MSKNTEIAKNCVDKWASSESIEISRRNVVKALDAKDKHISNLKGLLREAERVLAQDNNENYKLCNRITEALND